MCSSKIKTMTIKQMNDACQVCGSIERIKRDNSDIEWCLECGQPLVYSQYDAFYTIKEHSSVRKSCGDKTFFESTADVKHWIATNNQALHYYLCSDCDGYHLTTRNK
jgi:ribosomal protein L37AE/L43A